MFSSLCYLKYHDNLIFSLLPNTVLCCLFVAVLCYNCCFFFFFQLVVETELIFKKWFWYNLNVCLFLILIQIWQIFYIKIKDIGKKQLAYLRKSVHRSFTETLGNTRKKLTSLIMYTVMLTCCVCFCEGLVDLFPRQSICTFPISLYSNTCILC